MLAKIKPINIKGIRGTFKMGFLIKHIKNKVIIPPVVNVSSTIDMYNSVGSKYANMENKRISP